ncbi:hypothetical protein ACN42_g7875 [Penicillium freii]|uniref:Uncharacterized protein n=1 Tax=Penicillium freii TaxID=48697 RepID=A0A124GQV0_PENFR|nr:hypothetical protein ACN42_g7875 [Penicillium freii]
MTQSYLPNPRIHVLQVISDFPATKEDPTHRLFQILFGCLPVDDANRLSYRDILHNNITRAEIRMMKKQIQSSSYPRDNRPYIH